MIIVLRKTGDMTQRDRSRFAADTRRFIQERDRAQLKALRAALTAAQKRQAEARRKVIAQCRRNRERLKGSVKAYRLQERARINREVEDLRATARRTCELRKASVRKAGLSVRAQKRAELEAERHLQRDLRQTEAHAKRVHARHKRTAREVSAESDDEVRANIDADLVPVFDRVKKSVKASAHQSRTEAFLRYVEENPQEVIQLQQQSADLEVKRLLAEQAKAERSHVKHLKRGYQPTKAERDAYRESVPF